jgi:hypothetical protein
MTQNALACLQQIKDRSVENPAIVSPHLLTLVTKLYLLCADRLSDDDREVFGDVMEQLAFLLEVPQRADLSHQLAYQQQPPQNIVVRLARDEFAVAEPILRHSVSLTDHDLTFIVQNCSTSHVRCICTRDNLSDTVTDVIVEHNDDSALLALAGNESASYSKIGWERLAARAASNAELQGLIEQNSAKASTGEPPSAPEAAAAGKAEPHQGAEPSETATESTEASTRPSAAAGLVTEATLRKTVNLNNIDDTVEQLALLVQQGERFARHCLLQPDINALIILCKAENLSNETFAALIKIRITQRVTNVGDVASIVNRYRDFQVEAAQKIVTMRRNAKA